MEEAQISLGHLTRKSRFRVVFESWNVQEREGPELEGIGCEENLFSDKRSRTHLFAKRSGEVVLSGVEWCRSGTLTRTSSHIVT